MTGAQYHGLYRVSHIARVVDDDNGLLSAVAAAAAARLDAIAMSMSPHRPHPGADVTVTSRRAIWRQNRDDNDEVSEKRQERSACLPVGTE